MAFSEYMNFIIWKKKYQAELKVKATLSTLRGEEKWLFNIHGCKDQVQVYQQLHKVPIEVLELWTKINMLFQKPFGPIVQGAHCALQSGPSN